MTDNPALAIYAANSAAMAEKYEAIAARAHFAPVLDLFPAAPARVADIGAGSGRDAAWFAAAGYPVTAAEPVAELRAEAVRRHPGSGVDWVAHALPDLAGLRDRGPFDLITLSAVWHHVPPSDRAQAMDALAGLLARGGRLVMSLRHGPDMPDRGVYPPDVAGALTLAAGQGLTLLRRVETEADQAHDLHAGIRWTWLAFRYGA